MARPVLATAELRALEARFARASPSLMERAGAAVAAAARSLAKDDGSPILVVAGPGNNGGDAWVAAAHLLESFHRVVVLDVAGTAPRAPEALAASRALATREGVVVREWPQGRQSLVIDGLLGIGLARDVDPAFAAIIARINASPAPVLSIDVPSGLDADTGRLRGAAVRATRTLTFLAHKPGLHTGDGPDHCGEVALDELGAGAEARRAARGVLLEPDGVRNWLPRRERNTHKGDHGTVAIIGGSRGMVGAAILAGRAALHAGAGKVFVGLLGPDAPMLDLVQPELMLRPADDAIAADVLVVGPGAGRSPSATSASMFERTVMPAAIGAPKPLVLDADGLNALAANDALRATVSGRKFATLLTPHPAEAARLLRRETAAVQADRVGAAVELAQSLRAHVVLKGAGSVCAFPDGRWSINTTGNPALASGGTGDVLAGVMGALLAQGLEAERALQYAVCLHGAAADTLVARGKGPVGLTASEVALECRRLLNLWTLRSL